MAEPSLSYLLDTIRAHVAVSSERDKVLDAGRQLAGRMNQNAVRALAGTWDVRQKVGGRNRGTPDILREIEEKVRNGAKRLLQMETAVVPEPAAEDAAVLPELRAEAAAVLPEPASQGAAVLAEPAALEETNEEKREFERRVRRRCHTSGEADAGGNAGQLQTNK